MDDEGGDGEGSFVTSVGPLQRLNNFFSCRVRLAVIESFSTLLVTLYIRVTLFVTS